MIHPDIQAMLVRQRSATLLAAAAEYRRGRQARSAVLIRPVRDADAPLLAGGFARLGKRFRRLRFLGRKTTLTEAGLRRDADADHHDHEPLGALDHVREDGVGIARYVRDREDPAA